MSLLDRTVSIVRVPAELAFGVAKRAGGTALGAAKLAYGVVAGSDTEERPAEWADRPAPARPRPPAHPGNGRPAEPETVVVPEPAAPAEPAAAPEPPEPEHVSEEPELVAEVAEEGAEDGAGAEVTIEEPWPGYDGMTAADIKDRLVAEPPEVAAAVKLYEASKKGRASVLEASSRGMRA
jgi:hypothetical protein